MKFKGKGINLQVLVECTCYLFFGLQLFHLTYSGAYLNYVTPRMKPYLYGMSILMILWAVVEGRRLLTPKYKVKLFRSFVIIVPILLISFRPAPPGGSSMIRFVAGSPITNTLALKPGGTGGNSLKPKGTGQNSAGQGGSGQNSAGQGGSGQNGAGQGGSGQNGAGQGGSGQNGAGQGGSGQTGTDQGNSGQSNDTGQTSADQGGTGQTGTSQGGSGQNGTDQSGSDQTSTDQGNAGQTGTSQGGSGQTGTSQDSTGQSILGQSSATSVKSNSAPLNTSSGSNNQDGPQYDLYGLDKKTKTITVADEDYYTWLYELSSYPKKYVGYTVIMKGFVYQDPDVKKEGDFALVRLSMWCCAADLTPIGFVVDTGGKMKFKSDDWVVVKGTFGMTPDGSTMMLKAQSIKAAEKPKEEYVYPSF